MASGTLGKLTIDIAANVAKLRQDMGKVQRVLGKFNKTTMESNRNLNRIAKSTSFMGLTKSIVSANLALDAMRMAWRGIGMFTRQAFMAAEDYKLDVATIAALVTTLMPDSKALGDRWNEAKGYAEGIIPVVEEIAAQTLVSGRHATLLVTQFAMQGVLIDSNNKKQIEGVKAVANAIAILTKGQDTERQILTEIRSLMSGEIKATAILAKTLQGINPDLKAQLKLWKEQGTVLENLGGMLVGFQAATGDIRKTWMAVQTTIATTVRQILRGGMMPVYENIMALLLRMNESLIEHKEVLSKSIHRGWTAVKGIVESVAISIASFKGPLGVVGKIVGTIAEGWALIFTILPSIIERVGLFVQAMWESIKMIGNLGEALVRLVVGDFEGARMAVEASKEAWFKSGELTGEAFASGLVGEIEGRLKEYYKDLSLGGGDRPPPKLAPRAEKAGKLPKIIDEVDLFTKGILLNQVTLERLLDTGMLTWDQYFEGMDRISKIMDVTKEKMVEVKTAADAFHEGTIINMQTLNQLVDDGAISWDEYFEGIERLGTMTEKIMTLKGVAIEWAESLKSLTEQIGELMTQTFEQFASGIGSAVAGAIVHGESLGTALQKTMQGVAVSIIQAFVRMGVERMIASLIFKTTALSEHVARMAQLSAQTYAGAFAATAVIPIIGPVIAPGVAAAATAAMSAGAMASAAAGAALGTATGSAHGGLENVPEDATYALKQGERVLAPDQNKGLMEAIKGLSGNMGQSIVLQIDGATFARLIIPHLNEAQSDNVRLITA